MSKCEDLLFLDRNSTQAPGYEYFGTRPIYQVVFMMVVSISLICANFALIFGLKKTNKKLKISQKLYIYLSVTDLLIGAVCLPFYLIVNITKKRSCRTDNLAMLFSNYSYNIGIGTFILISYLRNLAIRKPLNKPSWKKIILFLSLWNIFVCAFSGFRYISSNPLNDSWTLYKIRYLQLGMIIFFEIASILWINYWSSRILSRPNFIDFDKQRARRNKSAVIVLSLISITYAIFTLPLGLYYITLGTVYFDSRKENTQIFLHSLAAFFHFPLFLSSGMNAVIYIMKDKAIKRYYYELFRKLEN